MKLRNRKFLLLFVLPVIYLILAGQFFGNWKPFYRVSPDPVYSYLFNGMTIANGNLTIHYLDHPGIPVQCFSAIVIFIKHLFGPTNPVYQDVLLHPESYLYVICISITVLYLLITLFTGFYVFRKTGNLALSLLFQLTPVIGVEYLSATAPTPESFILTSGILFIAYLYCNSVADNLERPGKTAIRHILAYGAFTAFLVSIKYTCFPLFFLVLTALPTRRSRFQYLASFILFFFVFISPSMPVLNQMFTWVSNLATHTGRYGQGDAGIINTSEFLGNFKNIFKEDVYFTSMYILLSISWLIALIKRKQTATENKIYSRLLGGAWISSSLLIILVAKHYSFHYLIPVRLCFPLVIVCAYKVFRDLVKINLLQSRLVSQILFYSFLIFFTLTDLHHFLITPIEPLSNATADFLNKYKDVPIINTADFGSSRIEPTLDLGNAYTGNFHNKYWEFLKKVYPYSYLYRHHQSGINYWDDIFYTPELFSKYPEMVVYFNDKDSATRNSMLSDLYMWGKDSIAKSKLVYSLKETNEYIYELEGNQGMAQALIGNFTEVNFDFEKLNYDKSKSISEEGGDTIGAVNYISSKEHRSGSNSILMNSRQQYALDYAIYAPPGSMVVISIWRKSDEDMGGIVFDSKQGEGLYAMGQAVVDSDSHGWKKIEYKCIIPSTVKDRIVKFYLFYFGNSYAYYDDLSIKVYPMKFNNYTFVP